MIANLIANTIGNNLVAGSGAGNGGAAPSVITLFYFPILGQSQAGGQTSTPALTTTGDANIKTLTNGPIDVSTVGSLIPLVEGDNFTDTDQPTTNTETIATSMCRQLKSMNGNNPAHRYAATVHATYLTTIQALGKSGSTGRYEEIITCVARMKALATANGWNFETHLIFFHGGTGDNVTTTYKAKLLLLASNFRTDVAAYTSQTNIYLFTSQQRVVGTPDYAIQQYEASLTDNKIIVCFPNYNLNTIYGAGDGLHYNNHGERYAAVHYAQAIYRKAFIGTYQPLTLDIAGLSYNSTTKIITIPILGAVGTIVKTTNCGIELYSSTTSAVITTTCAVSGSNLLITLTAAKVPLGSHSLLVRTGITANGTIRDSLGSTDISIFNDNSAVPYNLDKYMLTSELATVIVFPITMLLAFGGDGNGVTNPAPGVAGYYELWDNVQEKVTENYPLQGPITLDVLGTATEFFGFVGSTQKAGVQDPVTGTNLYDNEYIGAYWFVDNALGRMRLNGFTVGKTYNIKISSIRVTATARSTSITIGGTTITKTSNRATGASPLTTQAELHVFTGVAPNGSGQIEIVVATNATQFGYLNVMDITEE